FDNYDPGSDPNSRNVGNASTPFELSLYDKNSYILSQPKEDIIILGLLGIPGGIWSAITAFYAFLF
ncbi:22310_t:CDS:2, partial [Gigaspora rosea]